MYNPKEHWDNIGKVSEADFIPNGGKFGSDEKGNSLYELPKWENPPKWLKYIDEGSTVLDIGSGTGLQVCKLAKLGINAYGCDISSELIKVALSNCKIYGVESASFKYWDGFKLPYENEYFDYITTNTVLQHVIDENQIIEIFKEVSRVLKKDGKFCISELIHKNDFQSAPHVMVRSLSKYHEMAKINDLHLIHVEYSPKIYGDFVRSCKKIYSLIFPRVKAVLKPISTISFSDSKIKQRKFSFKNLLKESVLSFTNFILNPLVKIFKLEKQVVSQADMVFQKIAL